MSSFQADLNKISDWFKDNKMKINTKKCKIMRITRKKSPLVRDYFINDQSLESVHIYIRTLVCSLALIYHGIHI